MGLPRDVDARRYYRVAQQRLQDGEVLLRAVERRAASIYLSGYAVECVLKTLLILARPVNARAEVLRSFRGAAGHDLLELRLRLARRGVLVPADHAEAMTLLETWSTDLRYDPGPGDPRDAARFLEAARTVVGWAEARM